MTAQVRNMEYADVAQVVSLQKKCFPAPFPQELLWNEDHLRRHLDLCPELQLVAVCDRLVVGSASNTIIGEATWQKHNSWDETVGGMSLSTLDLTGTTLFGMDISVDPDFRGRGIAGLLYKRRFEICKARGLRRYGTACRLPDFAAAKCVDPMITIEQYAEDVAQGSRVDRTMTPLLRLGLQFVQVVRDHMQDSESSNCAAIMEKEI